MSYRLRTCGALLLGAAALAIVTIGCKEPAPPAKPVTPESTFEAIVESISEALEIRSGEDGGFLSAGTGVSSRFRVHNTIESKLIPPAKADEPYRGEIAVITRSIYSLRTSPEDEKDDDKKKPNANRNSSLLEESAESGPGFSSLDESLVAEADDKSGRIEVESVQRRADTVERKYELVLKNNRWELVSKIDKEKDAAIENAFQRALSQQP
jgi:hypothetical protein